MVRLLDFVQRTRVERLTGYISLYRDLGTPSCVSLTREQLDIPQHRSDSCNSVDSSFSLSDYDSKLFSSSYGGHDSCSDSLVPATPCKDKIATAAEETVCSTSPSCQSEEIFSPEAAVSTTQQFPPSSFIMQNCKLSTAERNNWDSFV